MALLVGVSVGWVARQLRVRRSERELRAVLARLAGTGDVDELLARVNDDELVLLSEGARFGDYEVHRALGIGGMSVVHLARHVPSDRLVALKVLSARLSDRPDMRDRFIREAQAANALDHDAVVPVIDAGEIADRPYIAMQFVEGGTLADLVRTAILTPERTRRSCWPRSPTRSITRTAAASSTATSSRATSSSTATVAPTSPTSASRMCSTRPA